MFKFTNRKDEFFSMVKRFGTDNRSPGPQTNYVTNQSLLREIFGTNRVSRAAPATAFHNPIFLIGALYIGDDRRDAMRLHNYSHLTPNKKFFATCKDRVEGLGASRQELTLPLFGDWLYTVDQSAYEARILAQSLYTALCYIGSSTDYPYDVPRAALADIRDRNNPTIIVGFRGQSKIRT